jgi:hypothetical protein
MRSIHTTLSGSGRTFRYFASSTRLDQFIDSPTDLGPTSNISLPTGRITCIIMLHHYATSLYYIQYGHVRQRFTVFSLPSLLYHCLSPSSWRLSGVRLTCSGCPRLIRLLGLDPEVLVSGPPPACKYGQHGSLYMCDTRTHALGRLVISITHMHLGYAESAAGTHLFQYIRRDHRGIGRCRRIGAGG